MKYEVTHSDGTHVIIKAENEDMARQFAMERKWGPPNANKTWSSSQWEGKGLDVKEVAA